MRSRHSSLYDTQMTEETKKTVIRQEAKIVEAIRTTNKQIENLGNKMKQFEMIDPDEDDGETEDDKRQLLKEVEERKMGLNASKKALETLLSSTQKRTNVTVTDIRISGDGKVLAGMDHEDEVGDVTVTIKNVEASDRGQAALGYLSRLNPNEFFK